MFIDNKRMFSLTEYFNKRIKNTLTLEDIKLKPM